MTYWRHFRRLPYPYNFPFLPVDHLYDLRCFTVRFQHLHSRDFFLGRYGLAFQYPAPAALIYALLYRLPSPVQWFLPITILPVLFLGGVLSRHLITLGLKPGATWLLLASTLLLGYPFWFEYVQANIEIVMFVVVAGGVLAFLRGRMYLAAILFSFAAFSKIYPFVFFGLLVSKKRWREIGVGAATGLLATLLGYWLLCPDLPFSYHGVQAGLAATRRDLVLFFDRLAFGFDHSLYGFMKPWLRYKYGAHFPLRSLTIYMGFAASLGLGLWFFRIRKLPVLNQIVCLTICAILLPPTSYEYTLLHMYIPWGLLVVYASRTRGPVMMTRDVEIVFVLMGVLFGPCTELIAHNLNFSGQFKCLLLVGMLVVALFFPWYGIEETWNAGQVKPLASDV